MGKKNVTNVTDLMYKERKCHKCGKLFIASSPEEWVYKRRINNYPKYFCSWKCLRDYDKNHGTKAERQEKIIRALEDGIPVEEICKKLDVDRSNVTYWQRKMRLEA